MKRIPAAFLIRSIGRSIGGGLPPVLKDVT
jgi:hypothetical protein